jgi:gliding motility-associated-like protein
MDLVTKVLSNPISDSEAIAYENEENPEIVYVEFSTDDPLGCSVVKLLKLTVTPNPTPLTIQEIENQLGNNGVLEICDGNVDGSGDIAEQVAVFDITQWEEDIRNSESGLVFSYHESYADALAGADAIPTPTSYSNISNPQTIYVSVVNSGTGVNSDGTGCNTVVEFDIYVPIPSVGITSSSDVVCIDSNGTPLATSVLPELSAIVDGSISSYEYQWFLNGTAIPGATSSTYVANAPGGYNVSVSSFTDLSCTNTSSVLTILASGSPDDYSAGVTTEAFADSHQIVATASSTNTTAQFLYSLDNETPQTSGVFDNVLPGVHVVTISDASGCWSYSETVLIVDFPKFFTPNGDGVNDTWSIIQQDQISISQIYIFNRYGKLLKQLDPDSPGWDGTYNGSQLPATDYWFKIMYIEGVDSEQKEFKAHFTLKR